MKKVAGKIGIFGLLAFIMLDPVCYVEPGYRMIKYDRTKGFQEKVYPPGWYLINTFTSKGILMDARLRETDVQFIATCKDQKSVDMKIKVMGKLEEQKIFQFYKLFGTDKRDDIIKSCIVQQVRQFTAQNNFYQILSFQKQMRQRLKEKIPQKLKKYYVQVEDVQILDLKKHSRISEIQ